MANVIINIHGGNNQILPEATGVVQNFYGAEFVRAKMQDTMAEEDEDEEVRIARGTLCIYYSDEMQLNDIIRRIADCRNASDLANLVVNDMQKESVAIAEIIGKYRDEENTIILA